MRSGRAMVVAVTLGACAPRAPMQMPPVDPVDEACCAGARWSALRHGRTPDARRDLLRASPLWNEWTALPAKQQRRALRGDVFIGASVAAVLVAWGPPSEVLPSPDSPARRRWTYVRCVGGWKRGRFVLRPEDCDAANEQREVLLQRGVVVDLNTTR